MNKTIIAIVIGIIIVGGASFYGGMAYGQSKKSATVQGAGNFANLSPEERQARIQQFGGGTNAAGGQRGARTNGGVAAGEILFKDDKSITVKLRDGGSKIIFFSDSTQVMKMDTGSTSDLIVGQQVTAVGSANTDGSISAQSVQIRPQLPTNQ